MAVQTQVGVIREFIKAMRRRLTSAVNSVALSILAQHNDHRGFQDVAPYSFPWSKVVGSDELAWLVKNI